MSRLNVPLVTALMLLVAPALPLPPAPPRRRRRSRRHPRRRRRHRSCEDDPDKAAGYRAGLAAALDAGYAVLERGGRA
jgi:hypothetical protein